MDIWIGIPTGGRAAQAAETVAKWKAAGFKVAVYTWDEREKIEADYRFTGLLNTFPILQNLLAGHVFMSRGFSVYICGADDLWPGNATPRLIHKAAQKSPWKVIWAKDGMANHVATHPIITRSWFERHDRKIFDEKFNHNYCDTDLTARCADSGELVKCFDIGFEHRHWLKNLRTKDSLDEWALDKVAADKAYYYSKHKDRPNLSNVPEIKIL